MRLTETLSAGGVTAPAAMLLTMAGTAQAESEDAATRRTPLQAELAALDRDIRSPEDTKAGKRAEPV